MPRGILDAHEVSPVWIIHTVSIVKFLLEICSPSKHNNILIDIAHMWIQFIYIWTSHEFVSMNPLQAWYVFLSTGMGILDFGRPWARRESFVNGIQRGKVFHHHERNRKVVQSQPRKLPRWGSTFHDLFVNRPAYWFPTIKTLGWFSTCYQNLMT